MLNMSEARSCTSKTIRAPNSHERGDYEEVRWVVHLDDVVAPALREPRCLDRRERRETKVFADHRQRGAPVHVVDW
jgi:hypothetical protein